MEAYTKTFGTWQWYVDVYNLKEDGTTKDGKAFVVRGCTAPEDDDDAVRDSTVPDPFLVLPGGCSTYLCYSQLVGFCTQLMQNHHERILCKLVPNYVPGKTLNLAIADADKIREILSDIQAKYQNDFSEQLKQPLTTAHKQTHSVGGTMLEVTTAQAIEGVEEYKAELARYNEAATQEEASAIREFLDHRLVLLVDDLEAHKTRIAEKLTKLPLMKEQKKRKLYVYDTSIDGPLTWTTIKKRGLSVWAGAGPGLCEERLEARATVLN